MVEMRHEMKQHSEVMPYKYFNLDRRLPLPGGQLLQAEGAIPKFVE